MPGPIFDTHAHYTSRQFSADREAVLASLPAQGVVGVCEQSTHSGTAAQALALARRYDWMVCAVGIHPESLIEEDSATRTVYGGDWHAELKAMEPLFADPKTVAVGECGLDHHWPIPAEEQYALFEAQIRLALELDKPIVVHDREAHAEVYELLKKYKPKGVLHCYSGSKSHSSPGPCKHCAGNRLPLHGPRACARQPLRFRHDPPCGRVHRPAQGRER